MKKNLQKEIEDTLSSIDSIKRVDANPYLFSKIKERLETKHETKMTVGFLSPQWIFGLLGLLFIVNVYSVINYLDKAQVQTSSSEGLSDWYDWKDDGNTSFKLGN